MPSSSACRKTGSASSSPSPHWLKPREVSPKLMHPSAIRLTFRPDVPRRAYCIAHAPVVIRLRDQPTSAVDRVRADRLIELIDLAMCGRIGPMTAWKSDELDRIAEA